MASYSLFNDYEPIYLVTPTILEMRFLSTNLIITFHIPKWPLIYKWTWTVSDTNLIISDFQRHFVEYWDAF